MGYIGVLALQGAFQKHIDTFRAIGIDARVFREPEDIPQLVGLVIPGGESTTIGMLMERRGLVAPLKKAIENGLPVFGTCAGAILLAKNIEESNQLRLGVMDIAIRRNYYGRQVDSFEALLEIVDESHKLKETIYGVFIRAPLITGINPGVSVLSRFEGNPVLVRQNNMIAASFHPELSGSHVIHTYFAQICGLS